jgi:hypothetical protein
MVKVKMAQHTLFSTLLIYLFFIDLDLNVVDIDYQTVRVAATTARTTTTTTAKPQVVMDVELKVLDVGDNFVVPRRNSPEFRELSDRVKRDVAAALTSVPGFEDVSVTDFES